MFRYPESRILVFCKAPVPGQVKTRLSPSLSPRQCADMHIWLSRRILGELSVQDIAPLQLWCSPDTQHAFFADCVNSFSVTLHQQEGEDLGVRMHSGIASVLKQCRSAVLIGCDSPSLSADDIKEAFTMLDRGKDLVLAPAEDGGYVLVGLTKPQPRLFSDMLWGNTTVMIETRLRAEKLGLDLG
ncbi:MAG: TIGR04282 family arsenosugar biosynthesis glycosyltransferase, partial [Methylococcales bacterium]